MRLLPDSKSILMKKPSPGYSLKSDYNAQARGGGVHLLLKQVCPARVKDVYLREACCMWAAAIRLCSPANQLHLEGRKPWDIRVYSSRKNMCGMVRWRKNMQANENKLPPGVIILTYKTIVVESSVCFLEPGTNETLK